MAGLNRPNVPKPRTAEGVGFSLRICSVGPDQRLKALRFRWSVQADGRQQLVFLCNVPHLSGRRSLGSGTRGHFQVPGFRSCGRF